MIYLLKKWLRTRITPTNKYKLHRIVERVIGFRFAYLLRTYISDSISSNKNSENLQHNQHLLHREVSGSRSHAGFGVKLDLVTPWPPEIGGPAEIAPFFRRELAKYGSLRTLVPHKNKPFIFTDSVLPMKHESVSDSDEETILAVVGYGEIYDDVLKYLKTQAQRNIYLLWHDPVLEVSKAEFLKYDLKRNLIKGVFVNSEAMKKHLKEHVREAKIFVLKTGAPSYQDFPKRAFPQIPVVSCVGTFGAHKYSHTVYESFFDLSLRNPNIRFEMAGSIDHRVHKSLVSRIEKAAIENFQIYSYVTHQKWKEILQNSILSINLRQPPALESSGALMDIIASGTPCIITTEGSYEGVASQGLYQAPSLININSLSETIDKTLKIMMANPESWVEQSKALQEYALQRNLGVYCREISERILG